MRLQKQQSAVELLTTYAWAILIVAVFVAAVAVLATTRPPAAYLASSCNIEPLLPCSQTLFTTNAISDQRFVVQFTNDLGAPMQFAANAINLTTTNIGSQGVSHFLGNCSPSFAMAGAQVLCTVYISGDLRPSPGVQTSTSFTLTYNLCNGNKPSTCQAASYKTTGLSTQNAAPSNVNFYTIKIVTQPSSGSVVLNGATYPNGVNAVYIPGNYIIFGIQPSGYRFNSWAVTGSSILSSPSLQNSTLSIKSNGTLTANFVPGATTTTVTFITSSTSTSTTSTSTTSTSTSTTTSTTSTSTSTTSTSISTSTTSTSTSTSTSTTTTSTSTSTISTTTILYPSSPSFTYRGSYQPSVQNTQTSPGNTLAQDGSYGYLYTNDGWIAQDEGATWQWDFGSSGSGNFYVVWYAATSSTTSYCEDFIITISASPDGSTWTTITQQTLTSTPTASIGSAGSPITSNIIGTYRYIKVDQYSTTSCMVSTYGETYVDVVERK